MYRSSLVMEIGWKWSSVSSSSPSRKRSTAEGAVSQAVDHRHPVHRRISLHHVGMMPDDQAGSDRGGSLRHLLLVTVRRRVAVFRPAVHHGNDGGAADLLQLLRLEPGDSRRFQRVPGIPVSLFPVVMGMVVGNGHAFDAPAFQDFRVSGQPDEVVFLFDLFQLPVAQHALQVGHRQIVVFRQNRQIPEWKIHPVLLNPPDKPQAALSFVFQPAQGAVPEKGDPNLPGIIPRGLRPGRGLFRQRCPDPVSPARPRQTSHHQRQYSSR